MNHQHSKQLQRIYLIWPDRFVKAGYHIYKIGRTEQDGFKRFKDYRAGSHILIYMCVRDNKKAEQKLIKLFTQKFKLRKDIGNEYFEGNPMQMMWEIMNCFSKRPQNAPLIDLTLGNPVEQEFPGWTPNSRPLLVRKLRNQLAESKLIIDLLASARETDKKTFQQYSESNQYLREENERLLGKIESLNETNETLQDELKEPGLCGNMDTTDVTDVTNVVDINQHLLEENNNLKERIVRLTNRSKKKLTFSHLIELVITYLINILPRLFTRNWKSCIGLALLLYFWTR